MTFEFGHPILVEQIVPGQINVVTTRQLVKYSGQTL